MKMKFRKFLWDIKLLSPYIFVILFIALLCFLGWQITSCIANSDTLTDWEKYALLHGVK